MGPIIFKVCEIFNENIGKYKKCEHLQKKVSARMHMSGEELSIIHGVKDPDSVNHKLNTSFIRPRDAYDVFMK